MTMTPTSTSTACERGCGRCGVRRRVGESENAAVWEFGRRLGPYEGLHRGDCASCPMVVADVPRPP